MALWIDDSLPDKEKYLNLSFRARACLLEVWCYSKRAKSDGVVFDGRLARASDAYNDAMRTELIRAGWWHEGGHGCGSETCPRGIDGTVVLHDFLEHQETSTEATKRRQASLRHKKERADFMATHTAVRDENGRIVRWVETE